MIEEPQSPADRVLARIGAELIRYRDVACDPATINDAEVRERRKTVAEICSENEKGSFRRLVRQLLMAAAARKFNIEITEADRLEAVPAKYRDPVAVWSMTESKRLQARAALRVLNGEDPDQVFREHLSDEALAARGVLKVHFMGSGAGVAALTHIYRDEREVQKRLDSLSEERSLRELVEYFGGYALPDRVYQLIADSAASSNYSEGAVQEEFWAEILKDLQVEILDSDYEMPTLRALVSKRPR